MFKKITYPILAAMLVLVGYLNFSVPVSALPPVAFDDTFIIDIDNIVQGTNFGNALANDTDPDTNLSELDFDVSAFGLQSFYYYLAPSNYSAYVFDSGAGNVIFTLPTSSEATSTLIFPYHAYDFANEESNVAYVTYTITNTTPYTAVDDYATTTLNTPTGNIFARQNDNENGNIVDSSGIAEDFDLNIPGKQTTFTDVNGTITGNMSGSVTFTPASGFLGTASYQFQIVDRYGYRSNTATIYIVVQPNQIPVAVNDNGGNIAPGATKQVNIILNDSDSENYSFQSTDIDLDPSTPTLEQTFTNEYGDWVYNYGDIFFTASSTYLGLATLPYRVQDNVPQFSNVATVTFNVTPNLPPTATNDIYPIVLNENEIAAFCPQIIANDIDGEDSALYITNVDLNPSTNNIDNSYSTPQGEWIKWFDFSGGCFTQQVIIFFPATNFLGVASTIYTVRDSAGLISNTATITVNYVHGNPVANPDTSLTAIDVTLQLDILANDTVYGSATKADADLETLIAGIQRVANRAWGTYTFSTVTKRLFFTPASGFIGSTVLPYIFIDSFGATSTPADITIEVGNIPVIEINSGFVQNGNMTSTFVPSITGPVNVEPLGTPCSARLSGTVNSTQLAAQSFDSNIEGAVIGDTYTLVTTVENVGTAPGYTMNLESRSLVGFGLGVTDVCVLRGDGTELIPGIDYYGNEFFNFENTASSTLDAYSSASGTNIFIIIQDFELQSNTGTVLSGGKNIILGQVSYVSDQAYGSNLTQQKETFSYAQIGTGAQVGITSAATSSNQVFTPLSGITIGEVLTYRVEIDFPPMGTTSSATFRDVLSPGLVFFDSNGSVPTVANVDISPNISDFGFNQIVPSQIISNNGRTLDISFGALSNNSSVSEKIIIEYPVIALDALLNTGTSSTTVLNSPSFSVDPLSNGVFEAYNASSTLSSIVEPSLVIRSVSATSTSSTTAQFIYELFHEGNNVSDAQDVIFYLQTNGPGLTPITISNPITGGLPAATTTIGSLFLSWPSIPSTYTSSSPITISFTGTLATPLSVTTTLLYPVGLYSSSISGASSAPLSSFSPLSHGRLYSGTSSLPIIFAPMGGSPATSSPTSTPGCIGACGGSFNNPGCMDPLALNYDKWATSNNGSCKYPITSPTSTPPTISPTSTPPTVTPIVSPVGTSTPTITYIPKAKRQIILQITGPLESIQTKLRKNALKVSLSEGNSITIPHIGTKKPVLQLPNLDPLLNELWMLPWGSTPDKGNNTVLVGHSYNQQKGKQWPNVLFDLDKVKVGEQITLDWKGKKYTYEVIDNKQFDAKDVYIEDDTKESVLTIYGCGKYTTKYRQVVRALLVSVE